MPITPEQLLLVAAREAALAAARRARPLIPSRTLRAALRIDEESEVSVVRAILSIPHYWALYLHDGRGPIQAKPGGFLVFFRDLRDDPRVQNGFPVRVSDVVRLTKEQFREGLRKNRAHLAAGGSPLEVPMIVVRRVGPAAGVAFFSEGLAGFVDDEGGPIIAREFDRWIQSIVDDDLTERSTATVRIG